MNQPAARDTTFDGIKPERVWIRFGNYDRDGYLTVTLEINGIDKVIREFYIPGLASDEGVLSESHNLSWIVKDPSPISRTEPFGPDIDGDEEVILDR